jgi:hypothetical protein
MSSAKSPPGKEPETLQSTRQMLDELDALMDRMLAIPVNDLDEPAPTPRDIVHMPTVSATLTVLEAPVQSEESFNRGQPPSAWANFPGYSTDPVPAREDSGPLPHLVDPTFLHTAPPDTSESERSPIPEDAMPQSITMLPDFSAEAPVKPVRLPHRSLASRCLLPLVWFNICFDKSTLLLGGPGRWLRGPGGRHLLGLTGLALLAAAGLWLVKDWLGWTW